MSDLETSNESESETESKGPPTTGILEAKPQESKVPEKETARFKIESLDDLRKVMVIAKGGDPNAQQTLNDFLQFDSNIERSNLPNITTVLCVAQLSGYSQLYYPGEENPFSLIADCLAVSFMAKGGEKSKQFVEMMKQTPSLDALHVGAEQQRSLTDKILGRGKE